MQLLLQRFVGPSSTISRSIMAVLSTDSMANKTTPDNAASRRRPRPEPSSEVWAMASPGAPQQSFNIVSILLSDDVLPGISGISEIQHVHFRCCFTALASTKDLSYGKRWRRVLEHDSVWSWESRLLGCMWALPLFSNLLKDVDYPIRLVVMALYSNVPVDPFTIWMITPSWSLVNSYRP